MVCGKRMPTRLKLKIYRTVLRPVLMFGGETWALRKREEQILERTEMRMLRWILGVSLREKPRNEEVRKRAGVVCISEKIRAARLRWFGHVLRRDKQTKIKKAWKELITGKRSRRRQRLRWREVVEKDMNKVGLEMEDASDRGKWRARIRVADPK